MRKLLPIVLALLAPSLAFAQAQAPWSAGVVFPDSSQRNRAHDNPHGIAVDGEGKIWIQPYYPRSGDSVAVPAVSATRRQISGAIYVFKADGTQAPFSPVLFLDFPAGARDTVGGKSILNSTGAKIWAQIGGRGLATDANGDIIAVTAAATAANNVVRLARIDHRTGQGLARANLLDYGIPNNGPTAPAVDGQNRIYVTGIFPGNPIVMLNPDLTLRENVTASDAGFSRVTGSSVTGDSVYHLVYDKLAVARYKRPDEFSAFAEADTVLRGIAAEAFARHPVTNHVWFGAGSSTNVPRSPYVRNTWYAFEERDLDMAFPTKRDSIVWNGTTTAGGPSDGRPRGIAFSPDGKFAYVIQFSNVGEVFGVRRYTKMSTAVDEYGTWVPDDVLLRVGPNPTRGATTVRFRGLGAVPVSVEVYDALGRRVARVFDGPAGTGERTATFDTADFAAGTYYVRFTAEGAVITRPLSVVR